MANNGYFNATVGTSESTALDPATDPPCRTYAVTNDGDANVIVRVPSIHGKTAGKGLVVIPGATGYVGITGGNLIKEVYISAESGTQQVYGAAAVRHAGPG